MAKAFTVLQPVLEPIAPAASTRFAITCAICCHNSAERLPRVLAHLAAQRTDFDWELIVIDNASTDDTARVARVFWTGEMPLRVLREPAAGQTNARLRALRDADGEIVTFLDDDNWPEPDFLQRVNDAMSRDESLGAIGGLNTAVSEAELPDWLAANGSTYAVGPQAATAGEVTHLFGAGLSVRKRAFLELKQRGFEFSLAGRSGAALEASEDYELCLALKLAGWRLRYDPAIKLQHSLPAARLQFSHLLRTVRAVAKSGILLDPYLFALGSRDGSPMRSFEKTWTWKVLVSFARLLSFDPVTRQVALGRLEGLFSMRAKYRAQIAAVRDASWRER